jgi:hypothetical protein
MEDNRNAAIAIASQCKRSLILQSYDLDPIIYNEPEFIEAIRQIAVNNTHADIKILIEDASKVVAGGHRLIELMRRVTSFIKIQKINTDLKTLPDAFLICDETAILYRKQTHRYEGFVNFNDRGMCRQIMAGFRDSWEKSSPESEFRRLHI